MKHKLISKENLGNQYWKVVVELLPDTPAEKQAMARVQRMEASEEERAMVNDYLTFNLGQGQVVKMLTSSNGRFALQTTTK